jgi:hypothetical protein
MQNILLVLHPVLSNAYTLFCLIVGVWALVVAGRNGTLNGQFWGAVAVNTLLAVAVLIVTLLLQTTGIAPARGWLYYLYDAFFIIVQPGTFALLRGRDDRTAAGIFAAVTLFAALTSATRVSLLTHYTPPSTGA